MKEKEWRRTPEFLWVDFHDGIDLKRANHPRDGHVFLNPILCWLFRIAICGLAVGENDGLEAVNLVGDSVGQLAVKRKIRKMNS